MAMQIQRGLVKYKDRSDIICTYGVTDSGSQYYFLDEAKLPNGNIIVTTTLLEAVDPLAVASNIGVIDEEGNVVISCNNKNIKSISSDILLVEVAHPVSESVLEAIKLRDESNAATQLVTTPATIKDKMNKLMSGEGRFVFNDQFSEATICDINGRNLVNDELYSFISVDDEKIYFCKNTLESEVVEYPLYPVNEDKSSEEAPTLNVETTSVTRDSIEKAINEQLDNLPSEDDKTEENVVEVESIVPENTDEVKEETYVEENNNDTNEAEDGTYSDEDNTNVEESVAMEDEMSNAESSEENSESVEEKETEENNEVVSDEEVEDNTEETDNVEDVNTSEDTEEDEKISLDIDYDEDTEEEVEESTDDKLLDSDEEKSLEDEIEYTEEVEKNESVFNKDESVYVEDPYNYDDDLSYSNLLENYDYRNNNRLNNLPQKNIFDDVTVTISNLVELNRNLQAMNDDYDIKLAKCTASRNKLLELSKSQAREISSLNARIARLESENALLESKIDSLSPNSNGDLVRVMADAQNLLGQTRRRMKNTNI